MDKNILMSKNKPTSTIFDISQEKTTRLHLKAKPITWQVAQQSKLGLRNRINEDKQNLLLNIKISKKA